MNPEDANPNGAGEEAEAIAFLTEQEADTAPDFIARVRNKIHRRTAASQIVSYSWHLPRVVVLEMISVLSHVFTVFSGKKRS
jgi:hypothetical protein